MLAVNDAGGLVKNEPATGFQVRGAPFTLSTPPSLSRRFVGISELWNRFLHLKLPGGSMAWWETAMRGWLLKPTGLHALSLWALSWAQDPCGPYQTVIITLDVGRKAGRVGAGCGGACELIASLPWAPSGTFRLFVSQVKGQRASIDCNKPLIVKPKIIIHLPSWHYRQTCAIFSFVHIGSNIVLDPIDWFYAQKLLKQN